MDYNDSDSYIIVRSEESNTFVILFERACMLHNLADEDDIKYVEPAREPPQVYQNGPSSITDENDEIEVTSRARLLLGNEKRNNIANLLSTCQCDRCIDFGF